jgi:hypothetical protein
VPSADPRAPHCFGSPATFTPEPNAACRKCAHFRDCAPRVLARVRELAKLTPLADLENYLEAGLRDTGLVGHPTPGAPEALQVTVAPPARDYARITRPTDADEERWLADQPVKVAKRLRPMVKRGLLREVAPAIAAGKNPFPKDSSPFLNLAMGVLLSGQVLPKAQLRDLFQRSYGWTEGTAFSHVAVATKVFLALGVANDERHCLSLRRTSTTTVK